jgi:hypothetical protein
MIFTHKIYVDGQVYCGTSTVAMNTHTCDPWSNNSFHVNRVEREQPIFEKADSKNGIEIIGRTNLRSHMDRIFACIENDLMDGKEIRIERVK